MANVLRRDGRDHTPSSPSGVDKRAVFNRGTEIEMKTAPTATLVARLKREAKAAARDSSITHAEALDAAARREGYADWHELQ